MLWSYHVVESSRCKHGRKRCLLLWQKRQNSTTIKISMDRFLAPTRFIFWDRLDLFFIFYFQKMREKKIKKQKNLGITDGNKQNENKLFFRAMNCSTLVCFNYFHITWPKNVKKLRQITQEKDQSHRVFWILHPKQYRISILSSKSQFLKPKHRFRYQWGQVLSHKIYFYNFVNMIHIFKKSLKWIVVSFLKFMFLPLVAAILDAE